jgi:hypothetical protein
VCGLDKSGKEDGQATNCYEHSDEVKSSKNHMAFVA